MIVTITKVVILYRVFSNMMVVILVFVQAQKANEIEVNALPQGISVCCVLVMFFWSSWRTSCGCRSCAKPWFSRCSLWVMISFESARSRTLRKPSSIVEEYLKTSTWLSKHLIRTPTIVCTNSASCASGWDSRRKLPCSFTLLRKCPTPVQICSSAPPPSYKTFHCSVSSAMTKTCVTYISKRKALQIQC